MAFERRRGRLGTHLAIHECSVRKNCAYATVVNDLDQTGACHRHGAGTGRSAVLFFARLYSQAGRAKARPLCPWCHQPEHWATLFATGLRLQGSLRLAQSPELAERIAGAVEDLDLTVKRIRTAIFGLEPSRAAAGGLRHRVLTLASEAADALGFDPRVLFDGPVDLTPDDVATELLAALREALANVARHAQARSVDIEVVSDGDLVLRVTDDGQGLPIERRVGGHGLANMEARATRLGGSMLARRGPQSGTAIEWRVPNQPVS